jgi:hypothetical protein
MDHHQPSQILTFPETTTITTTTTTTRSPLSATDTTTRLETLPIQNPNTNKKEIENPSESLLFEQQPQQQPLEQKSVADNNEERSPSLSIPKTCTTVAAVVTTTREKTKLFREETEDGSNHEEDGNHGSNSVDHHQEQQQRRPPQHPSFAPTSPSLNHEQQQEEEFLTEEEKVLLPLGASWSSEAFAWEYASDWLDDDETLPLENCFGVFHVKVLRAQRLSCPVGSSVQAILRLLPWKGKVRVEPRAISFSWLDRVCVQFPNTTTTTDNHITPYTSMVHSYSDETSPWPEIQIQLVFSPLLGMFEFTMATFRIACEPLMRRPGVAKRQWFRSNDHHNNNPRSPLVEVEAFFERIGHSHHPSPNIQNTNNNMNGGVSTTTTTASRVLESTSWTPMQTTIEEQKRKSQNEIPSPLAIVRKIAKHETGIPEEVEEEDHSNSSLSFLKPPLEVVDVAGDMSSVDGSLLENVSTLLVQPPPPASSPMDRSNTPIVEDEEDSEKVKEAEGSGPKVPESDTAVNDYAVQFSPMPPFSPSSHSIVPSNDRSKLAIPSLSNAPTTATGQRTEDQKQPLHIIPAHHAALRHLLRVKTYYTPATCCICRRSLMSGIWKTVALQCEVCKVDCCDDCRLQVDVQLPCGSEKAQIAVSQSLQHRWTLDKLLHAIAPFENTKEAAAAAENEISSVRDGIFGFASSKSNTATSTPAERGIGTMRFHFIRAHILDEHLPPETDPLTIPDATQLRVRPGDYYVRVSWNENTQSTFRTQTIMQSTGRPRLDSASGEMHFVVPHYGTEFKIECIDAVTDKPIGSGLITTQGTLQEQRDYLIEEQKVPMLAFLRPLRFRGLRRKVIELRGGLKNGYSNEFFSPTKENSKSNEARAGDIVGCIELLVGMEEDIAGLYGTANPYECPGRPGEELNMGVFQMHLVRLSTVMEELKAIGETYMYIVSWKNPFVTAFSLFVFVRVAARIDPAYVGSLPVLIVILVMIYKACKRSFSRSSQKFIQKEIEKNRKLERGTVDYDVHRPVGLLQLTVASGRNVRSPELGLPGNVGCRVYWDPARFMTEKQKEKAVLIDDSLGAVHDIGSTNLDIGLNPAFWDNLPSNTAKRLKLLMPNHQDLFDKIADTSDDVSSFEFPVLQPLKKSDDIVSLESWNRLTGAIVIEVLFSDLLNLLPGSEYCVGEVVIPFSDLLRSRKLKGWFDIKGVDTGETITPLKLPILSVKLDGIEKESPDSPKDETPQIFLKASWVPPNENDSIPDETLREASLAIQEEMVKSAILKRDQKEKLSLLGTSVEALNTVRGISANLQMVQNTLGSVLDIVESCLHAFDFTVRPRSSMMLISTLNSRRFPLCRILSSHLWF